jgi:hypothetical protein
MITVLRRRCDMSAAASATLLSVLLGAAGGCGSGSKPPVDAASADAAGSAGASGATGTSSTAGTSGSAGTGGASGASGSTDGGADGPQTCGAPKIYGGGEAKVSGASVTAAIVDETGAPVVGTPTAICGLDLCSPFKATGLDGKTSITSTLAFTRPALHYGDGIDYALLTVPLATGANDFSAGGHLLATGKLLDKPGAAMEPGSVASSGDVSVTISAGATVSIDLLTYDTPVNQKLRAVSMPIANLGPVLASAMPGGAAADFALVYGVAPAGTIVCPAVKVTVTLPHKTAAANNDLGWAPGAGVEFWVTTTDVGQAYAPYAGWAKMSDGTVSADGATVSTSAGQGFIYLDTFAIRKAP